MVVAVMVEHVLCSAGNRNWPRSKKAQLWNFCMDLIADVSVSARKKFVHWVKSMQSKLCAISGHQGWQVPSTHASQSVIALTNLDDAAINVTTAS